MGLITAVYPTERFADEVMTVAQDLARGPTLAYGIAKGLINQAAGVDRLDYHLAQELDSLARIADGSDFARGLEGFLTKKAPTFTGDQQSRHGRTGRSASRIRKGGSCGKPRA